MDQKINNNIQVHYIDRSVLDRADFGPQIDPCQVRLIEEAYEWLFNSAVILSKMHLVEKTLKTLKLVPTRHNDKDITNFPKILQTVAWLYNHAGDSE